MINPTSAAGKELRDLGINVEEFLRAKEAYSRRSWDLNRRSRRGWRLMKIVAGSEVGTAQMLILWMGLGVLAEAVKNTEEFYVKELRLMEDPGNWEQRPN